MSRAVLLALSLSIPAAPLAAQDGETLSDAFQGLFQFGDCGVALCLGGTTVLTGHGNHFVPAAAESGELALRFINSAITNSVVNTPIPSASAGTTFEFVDGLPVAVDLSSGPIFGERAQTLGGGRFLAGMIVTGTALKSIRGVPLDNLVFNFGHEDIAPAGLGSPTFENDLIQVQSDIDIDIFVSTAFFNIGLLDVLDIGVAVPYVSISAKGASQATILPIGSGVSPLHLFDGTTAEPVLVAVSSVDASASGIGDIAARMKLQVSRSDRFGVALLGEVRLPTGDEEDLLGTGETAFKGLLIMSGRYGGFTPHLNLGYTSRRADFQNNGLLVTAGFDQLLSSWATLAIDFVSDWQLGDSNLQLPPDIVYQEPFARSVPFSFIPDRRDNLMNGSVGFKLNPSEAVSIILNSIVPLGNGGVQPTTSWSAGLEFSF